MIDLARHSRLRQWAVLAALSAVLTAALETTGLPAALLLGPMAGGIAVAVTGGTIRLPFAPYAGAQALVGCLIAGAITPAILATFGRDWPLFVTVVGSTLALSCLLGWAFGRFHVMPGTTGIWGVLPGGATAMMVMSEAFGADARLVAVMHYMRVVSVATIASLIARFIGHGGAGGPETVWFAPIHAGPLAETLAIAAGGAWIGWRLRLPAGGLLVPLVLGAALHLAGLVTFELPEWLLAAGYAMIGWSIGLRFTRPVLLHAVRAVPAIALSIATLIGFSVLLAFVLNRTLGIAPLTAYLSTSPGGLDSVAIIAASSPVDLPFVMALQTVRFTLVILLGPPLARLVARNLAAAGVPERGD